ncbi:uncharacterized protein [Oscarella lobularis]|uniref:uncharacterized protein n=1 Tax=Oscarella lobularis TaxID=121494 RepID=UPI0033138E12
MDSTLPQESFLPVLSPPRQSDALVDLTRSESDEEGTSGAGPSFASTSTPHPKFALKTAAGRWLMRKRPSESAVKPPPPKKEVIEIDSSDDDDLDNTLVVIDLTSDGTCERVFLEISDDEDEMKKETPKESAKKKRKKRRSRQSLTPMVVKSKPILPVSERKRIKKRLKAKGKAVSNDDVKEEEHTPLCSFMNKGRRFEIVTRSRSKTLAASPEPEPEPEPELDPERQSHHRYPLRKCISRGPERRIVTLPKETFTVQYDPLERERVEKAIRTLPQLLSQKKLIIFVDLDNWAAFFTRLHAPLPRDFFVWGFEGGSGCWKPPIGHRVFQLCIDNSAFYLHPRCGRRKDAADFALCMQAGRLDERLRKDIPFAILSGDGGFEELERQLTMSRREAHFINPHEVTSAELYARLCQVAEEKDKQ